MRPERVDQFTIAIVSEAGEAVIISNGEFLAMMRAIDAGKWDAMVREARKAKPRSAARIRT